MYARWIAVRTVPVLQPTTPTCRPSSPPAKPPVSSLRPGYLWGGSGEQGAQGSKPNAAAAGQAGRAAANTLLSNVNNGKKDLQLHSHTAAAYSMHGQLPVSPSPSHRSLAGVVLDDATLAHVDGIASLGNGAGLVGAGLAVRLGGGGLVQLQLALVHRNKGLEAHLATGPAAHKVVVAAWGEQGGQRMMARRSGIAWHSAQANAGDVTNALPAAGWPFKCRSGAAGSASRAPLRTRVLLGVVHHEAALLARLLLLNLRTKQQQGRRIEGARLAQGPWGGSRYGCIPQQPHTLSTAAAARTWSLLWPM